MSRCNSNEANSSLQFNMCMDVKDMVTLDITEASWQLLGPLHPNHKSSVNLINQRSIFLWENCLFSCSGLLSVFVMIQLYFQLFERFSGEGK